MCGGVDADERKTKVERLIDALDRNTRALGRVHLIDNTPTVVPYPGTDKEKADNVRIAVDALNGAIATATDAGLRIAISSSWAVDGSKGSYAVKHIRRPSLAEF